MHKSTQHLAELLQNPSSTEKDLNKSAEKLFKNLQSAREEQRDELRDEAIHALVPFVAHKDAVPASVAALACCTLVELGADPAPIVDSVSSQLITLLRRLELEPAPPDAELAGEAQESTRNGLLNAPQEESHAQPVKPRGMLRTLISTLIALYKFRRQMKKYQKEQAAIPVPPDTRRRTSLAMAAVAIYSASPALQQDRRELQALASALKDRDEGCYWLDAVFNVPCNEPILVLEPSTKLGIMANVSGVDVNFILNMLLMRDFPHSNPAAKPRLSAEAAVVLDGGPQCVSELVVGTWNLFQWQAIRPDKSLPSNQDASDLWIWNEGNLKEIPLFDGRRVVLLGPPAYERSWQAQRTFAAMHPKLSIEQTLTPLEVDAWLDRLIAARSVAK